MGKKKPGQWVSLEDGYIVGPGSYFAQYLGTSLEEASALSRREQWARTGNVATQRPDLKARVAIKDSKKARNILRIVLPQLKEQRIPHKVVDSLNSWEALTQVPEEPHGKLQIGKSITIYQPSDMGTEDFVKLLDGLDTRLHAKGLADKDPLGNAVTDRRLGKSGLMSYRYPPTTDKRVVDRRVPAMYASPDRFGGDEVARIAKERGMYVEPVGAMVDRVRYQLDRLKSRAIEPDSLRENRRHFLMAMNAMHKQGKVGLKPEELKQAEAARDFQRLYDEMFELHTGKDFDDTRARRIIGQFFEDPVLDGGGHHAKNLERVPVEHGIRRRVREIVAKHARK